VKFTVRLVCPEFGVLLEKRIYSLVEIRTPVIQLIGSPVGESYAIVAATKYCYTSSCSSTSIVVVVVVVVIVVVVLVMVVVVLLMAVAAAVIAIPPPPCGECC
jgi:hypothetical protein